MIRLSVFLLVSVLKSTVAVNVYPGPGPELGTFSKDFLQDVPALQDTDNHAYAFLMPMTAYFDQSASLYGSLSQDAYQDQSDKEFDQPSSFDFGGSGEQAISNDGYGDYKGLDEKDYEPGLGVGGLELGDAGPATSMYPSAGPAINSYGHSSSGSSGWIPIKNPHRHY